MERFPRRDLARGPVWMCTLLKIFVKELVGVTDQVRTSQGTLIITQVQEIENERTNFVELGLGMKSLLPDITDSSDMHCNSSDKAYQRFQLRHQDASFLKKRASIFT